ncbi:hypothetical protein [Vibrio vulnificus]|uniref:hypothetical protein n=1 Tax=Vibrio vulnificus TaxID=672 RepID=UPI0040586E14
MKKLAVLLLMVILLIIGFCIGALIFSSSGSELLGELHSKTSSELVMFVISVLSGLCTIIAAIFAIVIYIYWKSQQSEIELMDLRKKLLVTLISMERESSRLLIGYLVSETPKNKEDKEKKIGSLCAQFRSDLLLFYILESKGKSAIGYPESLRLKNDFLDSAKELYIICYQIQSASSDNLIESTYMEEAASRKLNVGFGGYLGSNTYPELKALLIDFDGDELSTLLSKAALEISKENAISSI